MGKFGRNTSGVAVLLALLSTVLALQTVSNTLPASIYSPQDIPTYSLGRLSRNYYVQFQVELLTSRTKNDLSILYVQLMRSEDNSLLDSSSDKCAGTRCISRFFIAETANYSLSFYANKDVVHEEIVLFQFEASAYEIDAPERSVTLLKLVDVIRSNPINYIFLAQPKTITVTFSGGEVEKDNSLITYALHKDTNLKQQKSGLEAQTPYKTGAFVEHSGVWKDSGAMQFEVSLAAGFYVLIYQSYYRENPLKVSYQTDPYICPFSPEFSDQAHSFGGCLWQLPNSCSDSLGNDTDCDAPLPKTV